MENLKGRNHMGDVDIKLQDSITMDLYKVRCEVVGCIQLDQGSVLWQALVNIVERLWVP
jgi:hypothetical protein